MFCSDNFKINNGFNNNNNILKESLSHLNKTNNNIIKNIVKKEFNGKLFKIYLNFKIS